jgi:tripeptide aminopeptidase
MNMESITDKFLRYVSYDTQSSEDSLSRPSTEKQLVLLNLLVEELQALGISDAGIDEYGYVTATVPSNIDRDIPATGFLAHADTSPDMSGANVKPQIISNYDGGDIVINREMNVHLRVADFPELKDYTGQTLITTDGTTLLGADDKAGIAEIMWVVQHLQSHPEFKHGAMKVAFTPDEETGCGIDKFDVQKFGADCAYTVDGGQIGELEFENFNAAAARITIRGKSIHPGYAKNRMLNASIIAMELNAMLPPEQRPEHTSGYEGFYHLTEISGSVENAEMHYIIRDHDRNRLEQRKSYLISCARLLAGKYGEDVFQLHMGDQYCNMREMIEPHFHVVETARKAMEKAGVTPLIKPARGGTDGSRLSYMGLPCPNIFAGGHNFHGKYEFIPVESMEKACEVILNILEIVVSDCLDKKL